MWRDGRQVDHAVAESGVIALLLAVDMLIKRRGLKDGDMVTVTKA
jgi:hypothetical protein